jgi:hypothetical protein
MRIVSLLFCAVASTGLAASASAADAEPAPSEAAAAPAPAETAAAPAEAASAPVAQPAPVKRKPKLGPVGHDASGQRGRIHTVASGDTLWDISDAYLGTPWVWPSIWQDNPEVPNPHRIFPGDKLWISPTAMRRVSDEEAARLLGGALPAAIEDAGSGLGSIVVPSVDALGFVSADVLTASGSILGSPRNESWLSAEAPVFLSLGAGQVEKGDRFTVVRAEEDVRDPETNRSLGVYVARLGWVEVTEVHPESSVAVIRSSAREMRAGDRLLPFHEPLREVPVRAATAPVEGQVAFPASARRVHGGMDLVYLNRGSDHGLLVGSPLEVFQDNGQAVDPETGLRRTLPDDVTASLVVISAEPRSAVALVTKADREIQRGDWFRGASAAR